MIRRIAVAAFFCLWHSGAQAVAEPAPISYAEVFPPFTELKDGKAGRNSLWTSSALRLRGRRSM